MSLVNQTNILNISCFHYKTSDNISRLLRKYKYAESFTFSLNNQNTIILKYDLRRIFLLFSMIFLLWNYNNFKN